MAAAAEHTPETEHVVHQQVLVETLVAVQVVDWVAAARVGNVWLTRLVQEREMQERQEPRIPEVAEVAVQFNLEEQPTRMVEMADRELSLFPMHI